MEVAETFSSRGVEGGVGVSCADAATTTNNNAKRQRMNNNSSKSYPFVFFKFKKEKKNLELAIRSYLRKVPVAATTTAKQVSGDQSEINIHSSIIEITSVYV